MEKVRLATFYFITLQLSQAVTHRCWVPEAIWEKVMAPQLTAVGPRRPKSPGK